MSEPLLPRLRRIVDLAREMSGVQELALGVLTKSESSKERVSAIAALAILRDVRQALQTTFESLDVHNVTFDELLKKRDDDLVRADVHNPGKSVYLMHDELGWAVHISEVREGLDEAFSERLEHVVLQRQRAERLLGNQQD